MIKLCLAFRTLRQALLLIAGSGLCLTVSKTCGQSSVSQLGSSIWVYPAANGSLMYQPDAQGNHIADHSGVGYMGGSVPLPNVPVVTTVSPVPGDNTANIQNALDQIAAMTPDTNGFR